MNAHLAGLSITRTVTEADTAVALGSGDVPVLATPRLIAWLEAATCAAATHFGALADGQTSVGVRVTVEHLLATGVGGRIELVAQAPQVDGRRLTFVVTAQDAAGRPVAEGQIDRVVVDRARFISRVPAV